MKTTLKIALKLLTVLLILLLSSPAWAATVYVKDTGAELPYYEVDAASCDAVTAADTNGALETALNASGTNGDLYVCEGTYSELELSDDNKLQFTHHGQTIRNVGTVILDANGASTNAVIAVNRTSASIIGNGGEGSFVLTGGTTYGFSSYNSSTVGTIIVDGITVNEVGGACCDGAGIFIQGVKFKVSGEVKNNFVRDVDRAGIVIKGHINAITVDDNVVSDVGDNVGNVGFHGISINTPVITVASGGTLWADEDTGTGSHTHSFTEPGAYVVYDIVNETDNVNLTLNEGAFANLDTNEWDWEAGEIYVNIAKDPDDVVMVYAVEECSGVVATGNTVSGTVDDDTIEGHGIAFDGFNTGCSAVRNTITGNEGHGIQVNYGDSVELVGNIINSNLKSGIGLINPGTTTTIINNTIYNNTLHGIYNRSGRIVTVANNNIIDGNGAYGVSQEAVDGMSLDYNLWNDNDSGHVDGVAQGENKVEADPLFVNAPGGNFWLGRESLAIDAGADLSGEGFTTDFNGVTRPKGEAWDIGAYEWGLPLSISGGTLSISSGSLNILD